VGPEIAPIHSHDVRIGPHPELSDGTFVSLVVTIRRHPPGAQV